MWAHDEDARAERRAMVVREARANVKREKADAARA